MLVMFQKYSDTGWKYVGECLGDVLEMCWLCVGDVLMMFGYCLDELLSFELELNDVSKK